MDSQPERRKDFGKRVEVWWEGDNVYYRGTIFEYSKNTDKHTVYYDDGEKEKVSLATTPHRYEQISLHVYKSTSQFATLTVPAVPVAAACAASDIAAQQ